MPERSIAAASKVHRLRFDMVILSSVRPSDPGQPELPGKPVGCPASIAIGAIVGIVPAVLDDEQLYRTGDALRQALRVRSEEHTSELQSPYDLVCRLLLEKKKQNSPK